MTNFKMMWKKIWKQVWEFIKFSLPSLLMYITASMFLMMMTINNKSSTNIEETEVIIPKWNSTALLWTIVCATVATAYTGFLAYSQGGSGYEMLVTGNIKRMSEYGYKDSTHKEEKEYRVWKGFVNGFFVSIITIIFGILFGCNQQAIINNTGGTGTAVLLLGGFCLSGWSLIPFYLLNNTGVTVSFFYSCLFALLPIIVMGAFYILGAYGRRGKAIKKQAEADKASAAQKEKTKKINYGGLPGTKPKKRK